MPIIKGDVHAPIFPFPFFLKSRPITYVGGSVGLRKTVVQSSKRPSRVKQVEHSHLVSPLKTDRSNREYLLSNKYRKIPIVYFSNWERRLAAMTGHCKCPLFRVHRFESCRSHKNKCNGGGFYIFFRYLY